jgi:hypothetical protein
MGWELNILIIERRIGELQLVRISAFGAWLAAKHVFLAVAMSASHRIHFTRPCVCDPTFYVYPRRLGLRVKWRVHKIFDPFSRRYL